MWTLIFILIGSFSSIISAASLSDDPRHQLVALISNVTQSDGYRYSLHDDRGNTMDCVKIIKRANSEEFIGVYHTFINGTPRVNLTVSDDLFNWTWCQELAYYGTQPTIAVPSDYPEGFIVIWEQQPKFHLRFAFYPTWSDLRAGTSQRNFSALLTLSPCAEGTPNIYGQPTLNNIDVGFHFYDNCIHDRQARASLINFNQWTDIRKQPNIDNAILYYGVQGNIGDRDALSDFKGFAFTVIEGQYKPNDFGTWRVFVFDPQTSNADQVPVITHGKSQAFTNPSMTLTTLKGQPILIVTLFVPIEQSAPDEAGELVFYHKL
jgi:hypothetical protein